MYFTIVCRWSHFCYFFFYKQKTSDEMRVSVWSSDVCSSDLLARRNALDIHLGQRRHQRLLRPLVALEQLGREAPGTVLRHPQLQLADPRHQRARVMPRTVAEPRIAALALARAQRLVHL